MTSTYPPDAQHWLRAKLEAEAELRRAARPWRWMVLGVVCFWAAVIWLVLSW